MHDWQSYAVKHGIKLNNTGPCQFCGAAVSGGVAECHKNVHHLSTVLDFGEPANHFNRFLSVDALALQHYELHGPWNNYVHYSRLVLIFEKQVQWNYSLTPILSNIVNDFKRHHEQSATAPAIGLRGAMTTMDLLNAQTTEACRATVKDWAHSVYEAFFGYRSAVDNIVSDFIHRR